MHHVSSSILMNPVTMISDSIVTGLAVEYTMLEL